MASRIRIAGLADVASLAALLRLGRSGPPRTRHAELLITCARIDFNP